MMSQTAIPYILMRGGTSRGPYIKRDRLPRDINKLSCVLVAMMGSGHPLNIDGIGGGNPVTTKVAMLSRSSRPQVDIDYFFAQVGVESGSVDFTPTCGNILCGVGAAAIEMGLMPVQNETTEVRICAVNTNAMVCAKFLTPSGSVTYQGNATIDGVDGTSAPVELTFTDVAGSSTGHLLPTGNIRDVINGVVVTCMDVAMPMVIARASDLDITGYESVQELDDNKDLFARMEAIRIKASHMMGMGDCRQSVTPKFCIISPARYGGMLSARYFMPWRTHPTMAVTGSQCLAACALSVGTVADDIVQRPTPAPPVTVTLEHPMGKIDVIVDYRIVDGAFVHQSAGMVRTARKIAAGEVYIPRSVWAGEDAWVGEEIIGDL